MSKHFRPCAGAVVFNDEGKVFIANRIDTNDDSWQFPQGGIEKNETPAIAARRELYEETSICSVLLVAQDDKPHRYEFTQEIKENLKKRGIFNDGQDIWFSLFYFTGKEDEINLLTSAPEFNKYQWNSLDFAVNNIIPFKYSVYKEMADTFRPIIDDYIKKHS